MSDPELAGIRRFHSITVGAGILFCVMMAVRFVLVYQRLGEAKYIPYTACALLAGAGLTAYLLKFRKEGLR